MVDFMAGQGLRAQDVVAVVAGHPPVLSYSIEGRLAPFWEYMRAEVGIEVRGLVGCACTCC